MVVKTSDLSGVMPKQTLAGIVEKVKHGSTVVALSNAEPMLFGDANIVTFDADPKAQFVEESGAKSSQDIAPSYVTAVPRKAQVTYRTSDEFLWANEDYKLGILEKFGEKAARALARGLDLGLYHRINPLSGATVGGWSNYLDATSLRVNASSDVDLDIEAAAGKVIAADAIPNGIALDPSYAWQIATARYTDGRKKFPDLGLGINVTSFEGLRASVSNTVSGRPEAADTGVRGIVGDFNQGIRWGIQRQLPFTVIPYGDPDNAGRDLKGHNEVALRMEVVYAWYVFVDRFAVIETTPDEESSSSSSSSA